VIASTFSWYGTDFRRLATDASRCHSVVTRRRAILGTGQSVSFAEGSVSVMRLRSNAQQQDGDQRSKLKVVAPQKYRFPTFSLQGFLMLLEARD
jgi:hypothetical protein